MRKSINYGISLPERDVENGRNDPADIDVLTNALEQLDSIAYEQQEKDGQLANAIGSHAGASLIDHPDGSVTDAKIGSREIGKTRGGLQDLFTAVAEMFRAVTGESEWNDTPQVNLGQAASKQYVEEQITDAGGGDMVKSEYAANGVYGVVDTAQKLEKAVAFNLGGALGGSVEIDGSKDVTLAGNVDGGTY